MRLDRHVWKLVGMGLLALVLVTVSESCSVLPIEEGGDDFSLGTALTWALIPFGVLIAVLAL